ncbi:MAG: D-aminoacyl-tRNA deacylase [Spirochaetales bacterium]|nr:D-aminoacyl-tRNA deacylase [Spirochaetales bacterium]
MRAVIQRVSQASVEIEEKEIRSIKEGLMILLGVAPGDGHEDLEYLIRKITGLRIFTDEMGKMNRCVKDIEGDALVVSQFTLMASTRKGMRPSFDAAAKPDEAIPLYNQFVELLKKDIPGQVQTGEFGAYMKVSLVNDGPVTIIIDSQNRE